MRYFGGKARIAKDISHFMKCNHPNIHHIYYEPFCGGCSVVAEMTNDVRIASDIHPDLILMWKALQAGWKPPEAITKEEYKTLKISNPSPLRGFVGFGCSFGGKWFGGYASNTTNRNYAKNAKNSLMKKIKRLDGVTFKNQSYEELELENALIYCDPPYRNTTKYSSGAFDTNKFWDWVREMSKYNTVYVSEYEAPDDFICVWEKQVKTDMRMSNQQKDIRVEKLFTYRLVLKE